jgi:hypothetical protein
MDIKVRTRAFLSPPLVVHPAAHTCLQPRNVLVSFSDTDADTIEAFHLCDFELSHVRDSLSLSHWWWCWMK